MKKNLSTAFAFSIVTLVSCSSGNEQLPGSDTTPPAANKLPNQSSVKPFEPDVHYTNPAEVVSQYGPNGVVRDVVIDQNGTVWLAAWDGVVSYDGKEFTNHTLKNGLSHHRAYSVLEDSKGNMWFGTMGAGAYKYNGTQFTNLSTNNGMISNIVFDLFEDTQGNIWFATDSGVSRYDGAAFMNIPLSGELQGSVQAISQDGQGDIWIGTSYGLYLLHENRTREILTEQGGSFSNVRDICCEHTGDVVVAASRGLFRVNTAAGSNHTITTINEKFTGYVCEDRSANLLITADGISRFDGKACTTIVADVSNLGIFGAAEDKDGSIWYGAMDGLHHVNGSENVTFYRK